LVVRQRAKALTVDVYAALKRSPDLANNFGLRNQMQCTAVGICSSTSEGDDSDTDKDAVRFFYIPKGSVADPIAQLEVAKDTRLTGSVRADVLIKIRV